MLKIDKLFLISLLALISDENAENSIFLEKLFIKP